MSRHVICEEIKAWINDALSNREKVERERMYTLALEDYSTKGVNEFFNSRKHLPKPPVDMSSRFFYE